MDADFHLTTKTGIEIDIIEATISDVDDIMELVEEIRIPFQKMGINQWTESWPSREMFLNDIARGGVYLIYHNREAIGFFVANDNDECAEQESIPWMAPGTKHIVMHRLGVSPRHQKNGIASSVLDFIENAARENGCVTARFDVFATNHITRKIYFGRGYEKLAERMCDRGEYWVMEKML